MSTAGQKRKRSERVAALELPPGSWARAWIALHRRDVLLRIGLSLVAALVLCWIVRGWRPPFTYRTGFSRSHDVVARVPFEIVDTIATEAARDRARRQVRYVYRHNPQSLRDLVGTLHNAVAEVLAAEQYADRNPQLWAEFQPPPERQVPRKDPKEQFDRFRQSLAEDKDLKLFDKAIEAVLEPFLNHGQLERLEQKPGHGNQEEIVVYPVDNPAAKRTVKVAEVLIGNKSALHAALLQQLPSADVADPVFEWLQRRWPTTLTLDEQETQAALAAAVASVEPVVVRYVPGQTLAEAGQPLRPEQIPILRAEYEAFMAQRPLGQMIWRAGAAIAFILALFALCALYLHRRQQRLLKSLTQLTWIHLLAIMTVTLACWASADGWQAELVPVLLFGQTVAIAYSTELALLLTGAVAMIVMLGTGYHVNSLALLLGASTAAVLQLTRIRSRSKLIYVGLTTSVVAFVLTVGLSILDNQRPEWPLLEYALRNALWALVAGFIMTGLLPFIERAFRVLTDISLLEMGDIAHPLLQELVRRAPGTYNHSITVGSIAEAAAEAINARGLLARVGAYFHDIGKMLQPQYFIENQAPEDNRHQALAPAMSSLVIIAHVKDGTDLARQHGLPEPIVDLVQQHHGTTLVEYFFGRATEQSANDPNGGEVDESVFRYPGPRPQTKEAAVLMLADAVESACRTLVDPGPARIEGLVREIAEHKLDEGQFDETNLTLRELRTLEDSMIKSLIALYHGRVKYPEHKTV